MKTPIKKGKTSMKILKIENGKGFIATSVSKHVSYKMIEETTKEDILDILDFAIFNDIEMDELTSDNDLLNPVQKTIYSNLYSQFDLFEKNKHDLIEEVDKKFKDAERKYLGKVE